MRALLVLCLTVLIFSDEV